MPKTYREEKEGRIPYEAVIVGIMTKESSCNQQGNWVAAYLTLRDLYNSLIPRHREAWMEKIETLHMHEGGIVTRATALRMLNPSQPEDQYLDPGLKHKHWMEIRRAWTATAHELGLFFVSRDVERGKE